MKNAESVHQRFVNLKHCCDKTQCPRSEWHVGRHGRKAWLKDVAERRGLGVAGKRSRKAWLKGVVLRCACRIEDVGLEMSQSSVCLNKGPTALVAVASVMKAETCQFRNQQRRPHSEVACTLELPHFQSEFVFSRFGVTQCPRPEWHVGRHGRKAWLKDVAERRGLGVAGKRGRKAWLKGVVLRRAS